jgi:hypothetical protein
MWAVTWDDTMALTTVGHWVFCSVVVTSVEHSAEPLDVDSVQTRAADSADDLAAPLDDRSASSMVAHSGASMVAPMGCCSVETLAEPMAEMMGRPWAGLLAERSALTTAGHWVYRWVAA